MKVSINNAGSFKIPKKQINRLFRVLDGFFPHHKNHEVSLAFVNDSEIRKHNRRYRHKDKPTDVLSFPEITENFHLGSDSCGEIIISYPTAKKQAVEGLKTVTQEIIFLLIHGFLHLMGFDHLNKKDEQEMKGLEKTVLDKYNKAK